MNIDREVYQGGYDEAIKRTKFCLAQIEKYGFGLNIDWDFQINERLTLEEIIGALVSCEQVLDDYGKQEEGQ